MTEPSEAAPAHAAARDSAETSDGTCDPCAGLRETLRRIAREAVDCGRAASDIQLVVASKTQPAERIAPLLEAGHRIFGENRVQEAHGKWPALKAAYPQAELHLIGPLQSNKAGEAVALFDVIQTLDRDSLAAALAKEMAKQKRRPRLFVEINIGQEPQKAGVSPAEAADFIARCRETHGLAVEGLMCIPPADEQAAPYFALLGQIGRRLGLAGLSMGMSADYPLAVRLGATHVRVGTAIFGARG